MWACSEFVEQFKNVGYVTVLMATVMLLAIACAVYLYLYIYQIDPACHGNENGEL